MRIHTDVLTEKDIRDALADCQGHAEVAPSVVLAVLSQRGSRTRARAYEIQLGSTSSASFTAAGLDDYPLAVTFAVSRLERN